MASGVGRLTLGAAGSLASARLPGAEGTELTTSVSTSWDKRPSGNGGYTLLRGRIAAGGEYRFKANFRSNGQVQGWIVRASSTGSETVIAPTQTVAGLSYSAGTVVHQKLEVTGVSPTTVRAKVWTGSTEPAGWQWQTTDATAALQVPGHTGLAGILAPNTTNAPAVVSFDDYLVQGPVPVEEPEDPPVGEIPPGAIGGTPKNIIHLVGDGMGFNQVDMGSLFSDGQSAYQVTVQPGGAVAPAPGQGGTQVFQEFPLRTAMSTFSAGGAYNPSATWGSFGQALSGVTDSAAAATALASGVKTTNDFVGKASNGADVLTIAERAAALGKSTGVVSTMAWTHATPASYLAHETDRDSYSAIAGDILASDANVVFGAGHPGYDGNGEPRTPSYQYVSASQWEALTGGETEFTFVEDREDFLDLASGDTPERVLGTAKVAETLQSQRTALAPQGVPFSAARNDEVPDLAEMSAAALNILDNASEDGFFVLIEGGAIDWAAHANNAAGVVEEQVDFNEAVEEVVDWVEENSSWTETLVIVTADHETGLLWGPSSNPTWRPLTGAQGALPAVTFATTGHSNHLVPLFAKGPGSAQLAERAVGTDPVRGSYLDNTDVGEVSLALWGAQ